MILCICIIYLGWECLILKNKSNKTGIKLLWFIDKESKIEISSLNDCCIKAITIIITVIIFSIALYFHPSTPKPLSLLSLSLPLYLSISTSLYLYLSTSISIAISISISPLFCSKLGTLKTMITFAVSNFKDWFEFKL